MMECRPIHTPKLQFITVNGQDLGIKHHIKAYSYHPWNHQITACYFSNERFNIPQSKLNCDGTRKQVSQRRKERVFRIKNTIKQKITKVMYNNLTFNKHFMILHIKKDCNRVRRKDLFTSH